MDQHTLTVKNRAEVGKKAKTIRVKGEVPATIYGKNVKNATIAVNKDAFKTLIKEAGEAGVVMLVLEKETRPVLIHAVQRHPTTNDILHIEFLQVNLREKVKTRVPLKIEGEAPAVKEKLGVLLQLLNEIEVEALPNDLPEAVVVDVDALDAVGKEILVSNLVVPDGVVVLTEASIGVCRIGELTKEEVVAPSAPVEEAEETTAQSEVAEATQTQVAEKSKQESK